jgi:hypothetical protein
MQTQLVTLFRRLDSYDSSFREINHTLGLLNIGRPRPRCCNARNAPCLPSADLHDGTLCLTLRRGSSAESRGTSSGGSWLACGPSARLVRGRGRLIQFSLRRKTRAMMRPCSRSTAVATSRHALKRQGRYKPLPSLFWWPHGERLAGVANLWLGTERNGTLALTAACPRIRTHLAPARDCPADGRGRLLDRDVCVRGGFELLSRGSVLLRHDSPTTRETSTGVKTWRLMSL